MENTSSNDWAKFYKDCGPDCEICKLASEMSDEIFLGPPQIFIEPSTDGKKATQDDWLDTMLYVTRL